MSIGTFLVLILVLYCAAKLWLNAGGASGHGRIIRAIAVAVAIAVFLFELRRPAFQELVKETVRPPTPTTLPYLNPTRTACRVRPVTARPRPTPG